MIRYHHTKYINSSITTRFYTIEEEAGANMKYMCIHNLTTASHFHHVIITQSTVDYCN